MPWRRTALLVCPPEVDSLVGPFRARFDAVKVAKRIPPHVTILYPFAPADEIDRFLRPLETLVADFAPFDAALVGIRRFEDHVWLAPVPCERWLALIDVTCGRFPEMKPYGGAFSDHEPHLTVGEAGPDVDTETLVGTAARELAPHLPVRFRVDSLSLLEERDDATWSLHREFRFG